MIYYHDMNTPIGLLRLVGRRDALIAVDFLSNHPDQPPNPTWQADSAPLTDPINQFQEWFAGKRNEFDLALAPIGTPFQLQVWETLRQIPFGETWSYGQLAKAIGRPSASRAVGAANGRNPLPIVIPCHRVIGANGSLTGFGGGLPIKQWLLAHEAGSNSRLKLI